MRTAIAVVAVVFAVGGAAQAGTDPPGGPTQQHHWSMSLGMAKGRLGARVLSMSSDLRAYFGAPADRGILVDQVESGTPAADAGIRAGDVIVAVDGDAIDTPFEVGAALADRGKGDAVTIELLRRGKKITVRAVLADDGSSREGLRMFGPQDNFELDIDGLVKPFLKGRDSDRKLHRHLEELEKRLERLERRLPRGGSYDK